jgi:hypothetical protein
MTTPDLRIILRDNVRFLAKVPPNQVGMTAISKHGISLGTAQRVLEAKTEVKLHTLTELAEAFNVTPAQLITPNLGVNGQDLPVRIPPWPFQQVSMHMLLSIEPGALAAIDAALFAMLKLIPGAVGGAVGGAVPAARPAPVPPAATPQTNRLGRTATLIDERRKPRAAA